MFITLTLVHGQQAGSKIDLVVDKVFGVCYSDIMKTTLVMSDSGHSIPVKESAEEIKQQIIKIQLSAITPEVK